jgi:cytosine/adenosine deaminase-related metal-dependent hydrolase
MATVNGARALAMASQVGDLSKGAFADLIAIPFTGKISEANEAVVNHSGDVRNSMIDGQWLVLPN